MDFKELVGVFSTHATEVENIHNANLMVFLENNPGKEIPEYMKGEFNVAAALKLICQEIVLIKEHLGID